MKASAQKKYKNNYFCTDWKTQVDSNPLAYF